MKNISIHFGKIPTNKVLIFFFLAISLCPDVNAQSSNSSICKDEAPITLFCYGGIITICDVTNVTYSWYCTATGFSTTEKNPVIPIGDPFYEEGTYFLTVTRWSGGTPVEIQNGFTTVVWTKKAVSAENAGPDQATCPNGTPSDPLTCDRFTGGGLDASLINYIWEESTDGVVWTQMNFPGNTGAPDYYVPDYDFAGYTETFAVTTYFRVRADNILCPGYEPVYSNTITISVWSSGTIGPSQTLCRGDVPAPLIGTSSTNVFKWEMSIAPFTIWTEIAGETGKDLVFHSGLFETTRFRRLMFDVNCNQWAPTQPVEITVMIVCDRPSLAINSDNSSPDQSAMLDVKATDRGILIPRISTNNRNLIPSPGKGLLLYNSTTNQFNFYNGSIWSQIESSFITSTTGSLSSPGGVSISASPGSSPEISSILDVKDPTRGILIPRNSMGSVINPADGLLIYDTTNNSFCFYDGIQWLSFKSNPTGTTAPTGSQEVVGMSVKADNSFPHHSSILDISSSDKGLLIPRMTTSQRQAILPASGLLLYNSSTLNFEYYNGSGWQQLETNPQTPSIITTAVINITQTSAVSGGNAISGRGSDIYFRGVCYGTTPHPTFENNYTIDGSGLGTFTSILNGLTANTLYYIRAYAINNTGTGYGNEFTFVTPPNITTSVVTEIIQNFATCGGTITPGGNVNIMGRGVCWSIHLDPTTMDNHTNNGAGPGTFTSQLSGLAGNTLYYVRAYATSAYGTTYGNQRSFTSASLPAIVVTDTVKYITLKSAISGGSVTADGGSTVIARGVCWNTSPNPTVANNTTIDGSGMGVFLSNVSGLSPTTDYYLRAYATNSIGTFYGEEFMFTTLSDPIIPSVITSQVINIGPTSATCGGNIISDGGSNVLFRGVCWSTSPNPTLDDSHSIDGNGSGTFVSQLSNLQHSTQYYIRAYAFNAIGVAYGQNVVFTTHPTPHFCNNPITDDRDNKIYNTIQIGTQCWMKENMNIGTMTPGSSEQTNHESIEKYCYDDDETNCDVYGGLYQWDNAMQWSTTEGTQGLCPVGWHLPTNGELTILKDFLGGWSEAGSKMKEAGYIHWAPPNTGATNSSGFTALPGGHRTRNNVFYNLTYVDYFWSSSLNNEANAEYWYLTYNYELVGYSGDQKIYGFSVRCIRNF